MPNLTYVNGVIARHDESYTHSEFLHERKSSILVFIYSLPHIPSFAILGIYTVCRTFKQKCIMNYKFHLQRTAMSIQVSLKNAATERSVPFDDSQCALLEAELDKMLRHDLAELLKSCISTLCGNEYRLTVYLACLSPLRCEYHAELLPESAVSPITVSLWQSHGRTTPQVKTSSWLISEERARMSATVCGRVNDAVMFAENGELLEGISSNAFAIIDGKVYTAPLSKVLKGTMRTTIAEACRHIGVPFIEESPNIRTMGSWESFFISSML